MCQRSSRADVVGQLLWPVVCQKSSRPDIVGQLLRPVGLALAVCYQLKESLLVGRGGQSGDVSCRQSVGSCISQFVSVAVSPFPVIE